MNKITSYSIFILAIASLVGCSKYLDKEPDNRAKLTDPKKVAQLLGTAYPLASYLAFNEAMSDNAADKALELLILPMPILMRLKMCRQVTRIRRKIIGMVVMKP